MRTVIAVTFTLLCAGEGALAQSSGAYSGKLGMCPGVSDSMIYFGKASLRACPQAQLMKLSISLPLDSNMRIHPHGTTLLLSFSGVRLRVRYISTQDFAESIQGVTLSV
jgi:hypothetical protein